MSNQELGNTQDLRYGVSTTAACLGWDTTAARLRDQPFRGAGEADAGVSYASLFEIAPNIRPTHTPERLWIPSQKR